MLLAIIVREDITVVGKESGRIAANEPEVDPSNKAHPRDSLPQETFLKFPHFQTKSGTSW